VNAAAQLRATRRSAGLFALEDRGLLLVQGGDRVRWLDGMVSNHVAGLAAGPERSGCYATLLTRQGRIVTDLRVLLRPDALWLELDRAALEPARAALQRFIIADDVVLHDASEDFGRLGLEGPAAPSLLETALGAALALAPDACAEVELAGQPVLVAAFGWSGLPARQLFTPPAAREAVAARLREAAGPDALVDAGPEALEILRIEAGVPRYGAELDEEVLPAEAGLEHAISRTKGCYTGQEIVARLASQGRVKHRLVGFACEAPPPPPGAAVEADGRRVGEVTSSCLSPDHGAISLGYARVPHDAAGTRVVIAGRDARVVSLPFPAAGSA
jgi:folate-binding protein YgfZ